MHGTLAIIMRKFLDLTYYNRRKYVLPVYLKLKNKIKNTGVEIYYQNLFNSEYGKSLYNTFSNSDDYIILEKLVKEHGVFFVKFYSKELRQRINDYFKNDNMDFPILKRCNDYYDKTENKEILISKVKNDFLIVSIMKLNNIKLYDLLTKSIIEKSFVRKCVVCKNEFIPIKLPDWVYYGSNGNDNICYECPININQGKEDVVNLINKLINILGFIPNAGFNPIDYNFSSRVLKKNWAKVCQIIFEIGVLKDCVNKETIYKSMFGSWFKALVESKILPNGTQATSRGIRCIAKSGNECSSLDEMFIDNWLYDKGFKFNKEPLYPKHSLYNKSGKRRADWKVKDYYIEYFGLKGEENYDKKTKEKLLLADELKIKLISIFPSDLNNICKKLEVLNR